MLRSKTALLNLKSDLELVKEGKGILEQKRNIILREIVRILDRVEAERQRLNTIVLNGYKLTVKGYMEVGESELAKVKPEESLNVTARKRIFAGIVVPEVKLEVDRKTILEPTDSVFSELVRKTFEEAVRIMVSLAEIEIKGWRLAEELKKTVIRVNAIEKYYLPKYKNEIKRIEEALNEDEIRSISILKALSQKD